MEILKGDVNYTEADVNYFKGDALRTITNIARSVVN